MANMYSVNEKLNNVLTMIEEQLLSIHDTREESIAEIKHYMKNFPKEVDYNLYQYGHLLVASVDIRQMYLNAGYISMMRMSDEQICNRYMAQIGHVARQLVSNL